MILRKSSTYLCAESPWYTAVQICIQYINFAQSYLTPYDSFIFYNAIGQHENYFYNPVAVAKQIVNGTNYRFITIAEPKREELPTRFAVVDIYKPLNGEAYATKINFL